MKLLEKAESMWTQFRAGWSRPHKGKYISYKEMGAYSVGGTSVLGSSEGPPQLDNTKINVASVMMNIAAK